MKLTKQVPTQTPADKIADIIWQPTIGDNSLGMMQPGGDSFPLMGFGGLSPVQMGLSARGKSGAMPSLITVMMAAARRGRSLPAG